MQSLRAKAGHRSWRSLTALKQMLPELPSQWVNCRLARQTAEARDSLREVLSGRVATDDAFETDCSISRIVGRALKPNGGGPTARRADGIGTTLCHVASDVAAVVVAVALL